MIENYYIIVVIGYNSDEFEAINNFRKMQLRARCYSFSYYEKIIMDVVILHGQNAVDKNMDLQSSNDIAEC